jgi:serine/threonine protein kinase
MLHVRSTPPLRARPAQLHAASSPSVAGWQLVEPLHRGRWCSIWRARPSDGRSSPASEYAVKLAHGTGDDLDWGREMLRREAAVSRTVAQPHLLPVLSSQTAANPPHIVLPLLGGATLAEALAKYMVIPVCHALWIARQVAEALAALHECGWLHGDVKPDNVIVEPNGHATLIDLGFAQRSGEAASPAARTFRGTVRYAAPERFISATATSGASDCYSLGAMLFEMLTGRAPFDASDAHALAVAHVEHTPTNVRELAPQTPREVDRLVRELLAKNPLRRPTAAELISRVCRLEIASLTSAGEQSLPA